MFIHLSKGALRVVCRVMIIIHRVPGQWSLLLCSAMYDRLSVGHQFRGDSVGVSPL